MPARRGNDGHRQRRLLTPLQRFLSYCEFEATTGCVLWTGATTAGRGHHSLYGSFWYAGRSWYAHRWSAKFIRGLEIDGLHVDHNCPHIPTPNTLCVEHGQAITLERNVELQHLRAFEVRKRSIRLQVGLLKYEDVYGPEYEPDPTLVPFHTPPTWLTQGPTDDDDCPF